MGQRTIGRGSITQRLNTEKAKGELDLANSPTVPTIAEPGQSASSLQSAAAGLKDWMELREGISGSVMDKFVTLRDLYGEGAVGLNIGPNSYSSSAPTALDMGSGYQNPLPVMDIPPPVTSLTAQGAFKNVVLNWAQTQFANYAYAEVWRASSNALGSATLLGTSTATTYVDANVLVGSTYYYWVRLVNIAGTEGPYNAVGGTSGALLQIGNTDLGPLVVQAANLANGAVGAPALAVGAIAVGSAAIANGAIANAMIANLAVDNSKIANLDGGKINANTITASQIAAGTITGTQIAANTVAATNIDSRNLTIKDANGNVVFSAGTMTPSDGATVLGFNPNFSQWTGTIPTGWADWVWATTGQMVKNAVTVAGGALWSVDWTVPASVGSGAGMQTGYTFAAPLPAGTYFKGTFSIYMLSNTGGGPPGYLVRLYTNSGLTTYVDNVFPIPDQRVGGWQVYPWVAGAGGAAVYRIEIYQMATWGSMPASASGVSGLGNTGMRMLFGPITLDTQFPVTSSNVSTFIQSAAIQDAQIGNLNGNKITANSISTSSLIVQGGNGKALNADPGCYDAGAWKTYGGSGTITSVAITDGVAGDHALQLVTTSLFAVQSQPFPIKAGRTYRVNAKVRQLSGAGTTYMRVNMLNAAGTLVAYQVLDASGAASYEGATLSNSTTWQDWSGTAVAPAGAMNAYLILISNWSSTGTGQWQNVTCEEMLDSSLIVSGGLTAGCINTNGLTIKDNSGNVVFSAGSTTVGSGNLAVNGDFSNVSGGMPVNYGVYNGSGATRVDSVPGAGVFPGSSYWRMHNSTAISGTFGFYLASAASVMGGWQANTTYTVSFYARISSNATGNAMAAAWNNAPPTQYWLQNPVLTSTWQRYVFVLNFGSSTIDTNGFWYLSNGVQASGTDFDVCAFQVEIGSAPSGWSAPPVTANNPITSSNVGTFIGNLAVNTIQIASGAVSTVSSASTTGTSTSLSVTVPSGARGLVVMAYYSGGQTTTTTTGGGKSGTTTYYYTTAKGTLSNATFGSDTSFGVSCISAVNPAAGTYTFSASRDSTMTYAGTSKLNIVAIVTQR